MCLLLGHNRYRSLSWQQHTTILFGPESICLCVCVCEHQLLTLLLTSKLLLYQCIFFKMFLHTLWKTFLRLSVIFRLFIITSENLHRYLFWGKIWRRIAVTNSGWPPLSKNDAHFIYFFNIFSCFSICIKEEQKRRDSVPPARRH